MLTVNLSPRHKKKWILHWLRTKVRQCKAYLKKWDYLEDSLKLYECGEEQTMDYLASTEMK